MRMKIVGVVGFLILYVQSALAEESRWDVVARCRPAAEVGPGEGLFEVRYGTRGMNAEAIEVRGCGANRAFRKTFKSGGDTVKLGFYALPFFEKRRLDFVLEYGWDDHLEYVVLDSRSNYDVAVKVSAVGGLFFGDTERDGRWEIQVDQVFEMKCPSGDDYRDEKVVDGRVRLTADTLCKPAR